MNDLFEAVAAAPPQNHQEQSDRSGDEVNEGDLRLVGLRQSKGLGRQRRHHQQRGGARGHGDQVHHHRTERADTPRHHDGLGGSEGRNRQQREGLLAEVDGASLEEDHRRPSVPDESARDSVHSGSRQEALPSSRAAASTSAIVVNQSG
jgi:hypothetical protein